jgi:hypothetical protein
VQANAIITSLSSFLYCSTSAFSFSKLEFYIGFLSSQLQKSAIKNIPKQINFN